MDRKEFARRRRQFMRMIGKDAIAILPAAPVHHRNGDIEYAYRQDSHFYYLSGFPEPDAVVVLAPGRPQAEYLLFVREHDAVRESWDGARAGTDGAVEHYGADDAFPIADIDEILPGLMETRSQVYYSMGTHPDFDSHVLSWVNGLRVQSRQAAGAPHEFVALRHVLDDMRLYKSRAGAGESAARRADRRGRASPRHALCAARANGVRGHGRGAARISLAQCRHFLLPHRRRRRQRLRHALPRQRSAVARRRPAAARCRLRARLLRLGYHAHLPGRRPLHRRAARGLRGGAGGPTRRHRQGALPEITGIIRTKPPCA